MLEDFYSDFFPTPLARLAASHAASHHALEPVRRAGVSSEESALFRDPFVKEVLRPRDAASPAIGGAAGPVLSVESGEQGANTGKVPGPRCRVDFVVPDSDDIEESRSKWEQPRCPAAAQRGAAVRERPPITLFRAQGADDTNARLVPAATEAPIHKEDLVGIVSPALSLENEVAAGNCGVSSIPHSVTELQDQVVIEYWLSEE